MRYTFKPIEFKSIKDMPKSMRPRERMMERGPLGISDLELLCILLGSGGRNRPVQDLAMEILQVIDLKGKQGVTTKDLEGIVGLGPAKAATICACLEFGRRMVYTRRKTLNDPYSVFEAVRHYGSRSQEHFLCVLLNGAHELMGINVVSIGLVNKTLVHPREIFAEPLKERATAVVLAHNHPSGNLEPSDDVIATTMRIRKAGALLGIEVLDHIVFSEEGYRSMVESGEFLLG